MSLAIRLSCVAQLRAQEAIAAASGSSGSTVATGDAVTFAAIGLHDYTMQKRLDSDRAHQQPETKSHGNFHDNERRTKALMDELQKLRTRRDAQTSVPIVGTTSPFEGVVSRREQEPEQLDSDDTPPIEVDKEATRRINELFFWTGMELRARRGDQTADVGRGVTSTPFLKSKRRGDRL